MTNPTQPEDQPQRPSVLKTVLRVGLPVVVLAAGGALAVGLIETAPKAKRKPPARQARLVEVEPVRFTKQKTVVNAMGTVQPSRDVELRPRINGEIIKVSDEFIPGGRFREGEMLLEIDPTDFELAVRQRESDVAQARSELALEQGQQTVAKREFELLGETIKDEDRALVLRQPQLEQVRARLQAAEAALAQAKLNLERTAVRAPFNALIRTRLVNVGMQVTTVSPLATLTGTDTFWIEVTVPVDQLKWIRIPRSRDEAGSAVRVFNEAAWGQTAYREGHVIRLLSDLEKEGRMARLLIAVQDPMAIQPANDGQPKLLLGDYVRVDIEGIELDAVAAVDRTLVRDGNTIWVMNEKDQLEIRPIQVVFRGRDQLFIRDSLRDGERLVVTDLAAPVVGMPLRIQGDANPASPATAGQENRP